MTIQTCNSHRRHHVRHWKVPDLPCQNNVAGVREKIGLEMDFNKILCFYDSIIKQYVFNNICYLNLYLNPIPINSLIHSKWEKNAFGTALNNVV